MRRCSAFPMKSGASRSRRSFSPRIPRGGDEFEQELLNWCRERLAGYKCPRSIDFRESLPRYPTGKLYKRLLRDEYWAGHARSI